MINAPVHILQHKKSRKKQKPCNKTDIDALVFINLKKCIFSAISIYTMQCSPKELFDL